MTKIPEVAESSVIKREAFGMPPQFPPPFRFTMFKAARLVPISWAGRAATSGKFIVLLKPHVDIKSHIESMQARAQQYAPPSRFEAFYRYQRKYLLLNGPILDDLTRRDDVESITEDRPATMEVVPEK
ncbi:hypothetical protein RSOLAG22IIIB_11706 [Rhizoctonia solani]|uniref:Inhibitor I9 domain-containing protein n=1 Tax=Rhizoctonia solani TaxID=456999 RepID=A0A0K6G9T8_9AGAM|nr:hypothetical protein RSOLAG22IIIB_11706 [Rhizoctonia solani]